jgi:small subunit ribosomal protein S17
MSEAVPNKQAGKKIAGVVVSDKMDKTRVVDVVYQVRHQTGKYIKRWSRLYVHDEQNQSKQGDVVHVISCRPRSKNKAWELVGVKNVAAKLVGGRGA